MSDYEERQFRQFEPYPNAGVTLRCPNEPEDKEHLLTSPEKHEVFEQEFRVSMTMRFINNGRQWGFDDPAKTAESYQALGVIRCAECGETAEVTPWQK